MKVYYQAPINEQFEDSYNQRGLQPSTGGVMPIRKVEVKYKNDPTQRRGGKQTIRKLGGTTARTSTGYGMQAAGTGMQAGGKATKAGGKVAMRAGVAMSSTGVGAVAGAPLVAAGAGATAAGAGMDAAGKATRRAGKQISKRKKIRKVLNATSTVTGGFTLMGIWTWAGWVWMWFQLPFAILSLLMLALTDVIYRLYTSLQAAEGDGWIEAAGKFVGRALAHTLDTALGVINYLMNQSLGFNLEILNPAGLFLLSNMIVLVVGWTTLITIAFQYTLRGRMIMSGNNASIKISFLLLAIIGYAIPVLNLFPWFIFWTAAMMRSGK